MAPKLSVELLVFELLVMIFSNPPLPFQNSIGHSGRHGKLMLIVLLDTVAIFFVLYRVHFINTVDYLIFLERLSFISMYLLYYSVGFILDWMCLPRFFFFLVCYLLHLSWCVNGIVVANVTQKATFEIFEFFFFLAYTIPKILLKLYLMPLFIHVYKSSQLMLI